MQRPSFDYLHNIWRISEITKHFFHPPFTPARTWKQQAATSYETPVWQQAATSNETSVWQQAATSYETSVWQQAATSNETSVCFGKTTHCHKRVDHNLST